MAAIESPIAPPVACPKCGDRYGFLTDPNSYRFIKPIYEPKDDYNEERLAWSCRTCSYRIYTKTADKLDN